MEQVKREREGTRGDGDGAHEDGETERSREVEKISSQTAGERNNHATEDERLRGCEMSLTRGGASLIVASRGMENLS